MDLQKMAEEFAMAVMGVLRDASLEELIGTEAPIPYRVTARPWADVRSPKETPAALKLSTFKPIAKKVKPKSKAKKPFPDTNIVATLDALGTTRKMRALKKAIAKTSKKKQAAKVAKKVGPLSSKWKPSKKKAPLKKVLKKASKKKVSK